MSINEVRDQHKLVADRLKLAHYHAEAMKHSVDEVERSKYLLRECERCTLEAKTLLGLSEAYAAQQKN